MSILEQAQKLSPWWLLAPALLIRLVNLDTSLWYDEGFTGHFSRLGVSELISFLAHDDIHPPLYLLLSQVWTQVVPGDLGLRLLSVFLGTAGIAAAFQLSRKLFNYQTAVLAAAFLVVSPFHIHMSQELRPYALFVLLSTLAMWLIVKISESKTIVNKWGFAYAVVAALLQYTHGVGAFVIAGLISFHVLLSLDNLGRALKQVLLFNALAVLIFLPWAWVVIQQAGRAGEFYSWLPDVTLYNTLITMQWFVYSPPLEETPRMLRWLWLIPPVLLLSAATLVSESGYRRKVFGLFALVAVPVILISVYGYLTSPIFVTRVLSPLVVPLCMLMAVPINISKGPISRYAVRVLAVLFIGFSLFSASTGLLARENTDWRATARELLKRTTPREAIMVLPTKAKFVFGYYYIPTPESAQEVVGVSGEQQEVEETAARLLATHDRVWVVRDDMVRSGQTEDSIEWLKNNYNCVTEGPFLHLTVFTITAPHNSIPASESN